MDVGNAVNLAYYGNLGFLGFATDPASKPRRNEAKIFTSFVAINRSTFGRTDEAKQTASFAAIEFATFSN